MNDKFEEVIEQFREVATGDSSHFEGISRLARIFDTEETVKELTTYLDRYEWGEQALRNFPRLGLVDIESLSQFERGSLGQTFAAHMREHGLRIPEPMAVVDTRSYIVAHLFETHELWHVITGHKRDSIGEAGLDGFYLAQLNPSPSLTANFCKNILHITVSNPVAIDVVFASAVNGWLLGKRAKPLFGYEWNRYWTSPLKEIQAGLGLPAQGLESKGPFTALQDLLHEELHSMPLTANAETRTRHPLSEL